jgi:hypothetical protein
MNNNRLSTNLNHLLLDEIVKSQWDFLIKAEPLIHIDYEGRVMIITEKM